MAERCRAIKPNGEACKAWSTYNSQFCVYHNEEPEKVDARRKASAAGGRARAPIVLPPEGLTAPTRIEDGPAFIIACMDKLLSGQLDNRTFSVICYGLSAWRVLYAAAIFEGRLNAIERLLVPK